MTFNTLPPDSTLPHCPALEFGGQGGGDHWSYPLENDCLSLYCHHPVQIHSYRTMTARNLPGQCPNAPLVGHRRPPQPALGPHFTLLHGLNQPIMPIHITRPPSPALPSDHAEPKGKSA